MTSQKPTKSSTATLVPSTAASPRRPALSASTLAALEVTQDQVDAMDEAELKELEAGAREMDVGLYTSQIRPDSSEMQLVERWKAQEENGEIGRL